MSVNGKKSKPNEEPPSDRIQDFDEEIFNDQVLQEGKKPPSTIEKSGNDDE